MASPVPGPGLVPQSKPIPVDQEQYTPEKLLTLRRAAIKQIKKKLRKGVRLDQAWR